MSVVDVDGRTERRRVLVAGVGLLAVAGYASVAALQIRVWNPLAAAPGRTLGQITAETEAAGQPLAPAMTSVVLAIGVVLAAALYGYVVVAGALDAWFVCCLYLLLIVFGGFGYAFASFSPGMSLADTYGIGGADHAPGGVVLLLVSAVAFLALIATGVAAGVRGVRFGVADARRESAAEDVSG